MDGLSERLTAIRRTKGCGARLIHCLINHVEYLFPSEAPLVARLRETIPGWWGTADLVAALIAMGKTSRDMCDLDDEHLLCLPEFGKRTLELYRKHFPQCGTRRDWMTLVRARTIKP